MKKRFICLLVVFLIVTIPRNCVIAEYGTQTNLYNHETSTKDSVFAPATGLLTPMNGLYLSDFISFEGGDITISNGNIPNIIAMYNSNKKYIGKLSGDFDGVNKPITKSIINLDVAYIRVNIKIAGVPQGEYMVVKGSKLPDKLESHGVSSSKWNEKSLHLFGDSITYWDQRQGFKEPNDWIIGYPSYIREELGANVINHGRQGATIAVKYGVPSINTIIKNTDLSSAYAILITGGTNDNGNSIPRGELGDRYDTEFDTSTFIGALRDSIHFAYKQNPYIKIYLMTPNQGRTFHYQTYNEDMKAIAKMYGIPLIDINELSGINAITAYDLLFDGVHPNNFGYKAMADIIVPFLANH